MKGAERDAKEVLARLYAYACHLPRTLNALRDVIKVAAARKWRGVEDPPAGILTNA